MKSFRQITGCLFALVVAAACAETTVTDRRSNLGTQKIARPAQIHVYPFAATPADIASWSAAASRYAQTSKPQTAEEIAVGRKLGVLVAKELVREIQKMGLSASEAGNQTAPKVNDLLIVGYFESIDEGSAGKRMALGFGSGAAELRTAVEGYQMTNDGPRLIGSGELRSGGGKIPGAAAPLVLFATTRNPIGLIIGGTANVAGEVTGRNTIEGAAERTAKEISNQLRVRFKEQGWIR